MMAGELSDKQAVLQSLIDSLMTVVDWWYARPTVDSSASVRSVETLLDDD